MKLIYSVSHADYKEAILFQLRQKQKSPLTMLRYWVGNIGFFGLAVFFALSRTAYPPWLRIAPVVVAAIMLALGSYSVFALRAQADRLLKRYIENGTLDKDFWKPHTLIVSQDSLKLSYGGKTMKIPCTDAGAIYRGDSASLLIAEGAIFDIIPNDTLDRDSAGDLLTRTIRESVESLRAKQAKAISDELEKEDIKTICSGIGNVAQYEEGQLLGYRMYYSTLHAWKGSQTICIILLCYGLFMAISGLEVYIGLAFIVIGILLNRRLLTTFTPIARLMLRQQLASDGVEDGGTDYYYTTETELVSVVSGLTLRLKKKDIVAKRETKKFLIFYTDNQNMLVIPKTVFDTESQETAFIQ